MQRCSVQVADAELLPDQLLAQKGVPAVTSVVMCCAEPHSHSANVEWRQLRHDLRLVSWGLPCSIHEVRIFFKGFIGASCINCSGSQTIAVTVFLLVQFHVCFIKIIEQ